jgi:hypothetical protein
MGMWGVWCVAALLAWPSPRAAALNPQACAKKRVDACGCHHLYGLRHCHPNRKGPHCELPVRGEGGEPSGSQAGGRVEPATLR